MRCPRLAVEGRLRHVSRVGKKPRRKSRRDTFEVLGIPPDPAAAGWRILCKKRYRVCATFGGQMGDLPAERLEMLRDAIGEQRFNAMSSLDTRMETSVTNQQVAAALSGKLASAGIRGESIVDDEYTIVPPPHSHTALLIETEEGTLHLVRRLVKLGVAVEAETS